FLATNTADDHNRAPKQEVLIDANTNYRAARFAGIAVQVDCAEERTHILDSCICANHICQIKPYDQIYDYSTESVVYKVDGKEIGCAFNQVDTQKIHSRCSTRHNQTKCRRKVTISATKRLSARSERLCCRSHCAA